MTEEDYKNALTHVTEQFSSLERSTDRCFSYLMIVVYTVTLFSLFFGGIL